MHYRLQKGKGPGDVCVLRMTLQLPVDSQARHPQGAELFPREQAMVHITVVSGNTSDLKWLLTMFSNLYI